MADRDELIAVLHAAQCLDAQQGHCDDAVCPQAVGVQADAILARWRLVPVEEGCVGRDHQWAIGAPTCTRCGYISEQHRAASELTRHDQAAGIYDDCTCAGREQRPHRRSYNGDPNRDDLAAGLYIPPKRRTDNHGPHED